MTSAVHADRGQSRPSDALAANVLAYRLLRQLTQDDLAARMTHLCHGWGRSTVSAVEGKGRKVSVDELFGLAVCFGVTIGQLLDPTGPDHSRKLRLDVGLADGGGPPPIEADVAGLWGASRIVVRLWHDEGIDLEIKVADDVATSAQQTLDALRPTAEPSKP